MPFTAVSKVTPIAPPTGCDIRPVPTCNRNLIASSECAKLNHVGLDRCVRVIIADHVTFSQSVAGLLLLSHSNLSNVRAFERAVVV